MANEQRFVLDTNVIISALLLKRSVARQAFDKALSEGKVLMSQSTIEELDDVLHRPAFDKYVTEEERTLFITALVHEVVLIEVSAKIKACRDPKDDKLLEVAVDGQATCIISGDQDLLVLNPFRNIRIMTPREFLEQTEKKN